MSIKLMSQVWESAPVEGSALLVLLALADHANDKDICWPSLPTLAKRARISERQTQRIIQKLADDGHIEVLSKGDGRGHSSKYKLTIKGDIQDKDDIAMSPIENIKDDTMSTFNEERVTSETERVTSSAIKGDIAMSTESLEPLKEPETKEEEKARDPVSVAWRQAYAETEMPPKLADSLQKLVKECGMAATLHGIKASAAKTEGRNYLYIAECARNYVPPAPKASYATGNVYSNGAPDLPGVYALQPDTNGHKPPPLPAPMPHDDPWAVVMAELTQAAPTWLHWLAGSYLQANGVIAGEPLYRVVLTEPRADAQWMTVQAEPAIRKKLASVLGRRILLEITTAERVPA